MHVFVAQELLPNLERVPSPSQRWCPQWWDHPEALKRLMALWDAWEQQQTDPKANLSDWYINHHDPQLADIQAPTGPFASCDTQTHNQTPPLPSTTPPQSPTNLSTWHG